MSILKKIGLGQKKPEISPAIGSGKRREREKKSERKNKYYRALILIAFLGIVIFILPRSTFQPVDSYTIGEPWRSDDLTAPFTFSIKKTAEELEQERETIREQTEPVFHIDTDAAANMQAELDNIFREMQPVLDSYTQWRRAVENGSSSADSDSIRYMQEKEFSEVLISESAWNLLAENHAQVIFNDLPQDQSYMSQIRSELSGIIDKYTDNGIIDRDKSTIEQEDITIRSLEDLTQRTVSKQTVRDMGEATSSARRQLDRTFPNDLAETAMQILSLVLQPNLYFNEADTEANYNENLSNMSLTKGAVDQGQIIIRRGDIVTRDTANILNSLAEARSLTATSLERWMRYLGETIIIAIAIMMFFIYIYLYRKPIFERPLMFFLVFLVLTLVILPSAFIYPFESVNSLIIPIAISPIILTIIFDSRVGLMATVSLAIITGVIHDYNFEYLVATIAACSLGVFSVRDIKKRSQFFFITPGIVFMTYLLVSAGFSLARFTGWETFVENLFFIGVNSVFILFTYPLILLFEKLFKITTDFTLLELADTNLPLMKQLMNKAPGTFHHSLQVANLAESAASNIGANALLCRVGAMYHDIGKMVKPSYFIENQNKNNDHDKLKPRMSALVIKAHVSEGVKIAREHNLPEVLIDFIRTHHGTSLIRYFHSKAIESSENVMDEDFRYDGPIPFTKEQGILMLADGVEASCRSMKDTTYNKLEAQINRIVDGNINDEQLSNCPLTFKQIQIIKESFLSILKGVYHSRIEYPDEDEQQDTGVSDKPGRKTTSPKPSDSPQ